MYTLSVTFAVGTQATGVSSMCVFFKESFSPMSIKSPKLSATRQVINYLVAGRSLTSAQARTKFGVKSMPKMMDCIANLLESQGNWEVTKSDSGAYSVEDTHPGTRSYKFDRFGSRTLIA